jgi:asparagine synthase (glutamine-hydrolysing)
MWILFSLEGEYMCGIFGVLYHRNGIEPKRELLEASAGKLHHRGPDNYSIYSAENIGLVHTRLALLDLNPRSNQPFWDKSKRYCLVYNGEIYNFEELREDLQQKDIAFRTTSDTEVLLESILHYGIDQTLPKLEGMFAFALWDSVENTLTLALDRYGIKPLYIYEDSEKFIFSSEIKGMMPWLSLKPDFISISAFLQGSGGPTRDFCFFENIIRVKPGSKYVIGKGNTAVRESFFETGDFLQPEKIDRLKSLNPKQVVDEAEKLLLESVRKHLLADAPVGAFCSGGIDSSILMAMAAKFHSNLAIFHANVEGPFSEYDAALKLSKHLKLDLKVINVNDQDYIK